MCSCGVRQTGFVYLLYYEMVWVTLCSQINFLTSPSLCAFVCKGEMIIVSAL